MTAIAVNAAEAVSVQRLTAPLLLFASAFVIAQTADHLDLSVTIDDLQKQEIYASGEDWRKPELSAEEEEWRQPDEPVDVAPKSRITFGYESFYDDPQMRRDQTTTTHDLEIEKYRPSSAFQIKF